MGAEKIKRQVAPKLDAAMDWLIDQAKDSNITLGEIPDIVDAGIQVGKTVVTVAKDRKITLQEGLQVWQSLAQFGKVWQAARKD